MFASSWSQGASFQLLLDLVAGHRPRTLVTRADAFAGRYCRGSRWQAVLGGVFLCLCHFCSKECFHWKKKDTEKLSESYVGKKIISASQEYFPCQVWEAKTIDQWWLRAQKTSLRFDADIGCGTAKELLKWVDFVQASLSIPLRLVTGDTEGPPGEVPPVGGDRLMGLWDMVTINDHWPQLITLYHYYITHFSQ